MREFWGLIESMLSAEIKTKHFFVALKLFNQKYLIKYSEFRLFIFDYFSEIILELKFLLSLHKILNKIDD